MPPPLAVAGRARRSIPPRARRRAVAVAEAERRGQRIAVQFVESIKLADQGHDQLVQPVEGRVGFELDPLGPQDPRAARRRRVGSVVQQRRLAYPRIPDDHQCAASEQPDRGTTRSAPTPRLARAGPQAGRTITVLNTAVARNGSSH